MKPGGQRVKGAAFERLIAADLREHLGLENVRRNLNQYQIADEGDLIAGPFVVECKHYKPNGTVWFQKDWWDQVIKAAGEDYIPILVFKYDRHPVRAALPLAALNDDYDPDVVGWEKALSPLVTDWQTALMIMGDILAEEVEDAIVRN